MLFDIPIQWIPRIVMWGIFLLNGAVMKRAVNRALIVVLLFNLIGFVRAENPEILWHKGSFSHQNLLSGAQYRWEDDHILLNDVSVTNPVPDTLRILAIRVAFQTDDDPRTTGDGRFDLIWTFCLQFGICRDYKYSFLLTPGYFMAILLIRQVCSSDAKGPHRAKYCNCLSPIVAPRANLAIALLSPLEMRPLKNWTFR